MKDRAGRLHSLSASWELLAETLELKLAHLARRRREIEKDREEIHALVDGWNAGGMLAIASPARQVSKLDDAEAALERKADQLRRDLFRIRLRCELGSSLARRLEAERECKADVASSLELLGTFHGQAPDKSGLLD